MNGRGRPETPNGFRPGAIPSQCSNGEQDSNEGGVDCGGPCKACDNSGCADSTSWSFTLYSGATYTCQDYNFDANAVDNPANQQNINNYFCRFDGADRPGACPIACGNTDCSPTCDDGVLNGMENSIDCYRDPDTQTENFGLCPCPTCTDGSQNGDETDVDSGGSCGPPVSPPDASPLPPDQEDFYGDREVKCCTDDTFDDPKLEIGGGGGGTMTTDYEDEIRLCSHETRTICYESGGTIYDGDRVAWEANI